MSQQTKIKFQTQLEKIQHKFIAKITERMTDDLNMWMRRTGFPLDEEGMEAITIKAQELMVNAEMLFGTELQESTIKALEAFEETIEKEQKVNHVATPLEVTKMGTSSQDSNKKKSPGRPKKHQLSGNQEVLGD